MPTDNPKISLYVPQKIYNRFKEFQEQRNLSMSQAGIVILAEYFGIEETIHEVNIETTIGGVTLARVEKLEKEMQKLKDLIERNNCHDDDDYTDNDSTNKSEIELSYNNFYCPSNPMDLLHPEFKNMSLNEVALAILEKSDTPMSITQVARAAYDTKTEAEFKRAKGSIGAILRVGVNKEDPSQGLWVKTNRGVYASHSYLRKPLILN